MRPRRHAAGVVVRVHSRRRCDPRHNRPVSVRVPLAAAPGSLIFFVVGEVDAGDDAAAQLGDVGNAGIDDRDADPRARQPGNPRQPGLYLVGPDRLVRHRHLRVHAVVAGQVIDSRIARQLLEPVRRHVQHRSALQPLRDPQTMPRRHLVDPHLRPGEDHRRAGEVTVAELLRQILRQRRPLARPLRGRLRRHAHEHCRQQTGHELDCSKRHEGAGGVRHGHDPLKTGVMNGSGRRTTQPTQRRKMRGAGIPDLEATR